VTAATTQTMLLLTSSASSIVYAQLGDTPWDWAAVMLPMAFAATLAGQVSQQVEKFGKKSYFRSRGIQNVRLHKHQIDRYETNMGLSHAKFINIGNWLHAVLKRAPAALGLGHSRAADGVRGHTRRTGVAVQQGGWLGLLQTLSVGSGPLRVVGVGMCGKCH
jgi:hypothetical protein